MPYKGGSKIPLRGALKSAKARYIGVIANVRDWTRSSISEREEYLCSLTPTNAPHCSFAPRLHTKHTWSVYPTPIRVQPHVQRFALAASQTVVTSIHHISATERIVTARKQQRKHIEADETHETYSTTPATITKRRSLFTELAFYSPEFSEARMK